MRSDGHLPPLVLVEQDRKPQAPRAARLKLAEQEKVDTAIKHTNKWIKYVKFGTEVIDPASLLKLTRLWV